MKKYFMILMLSLAGLAANAQGRVYVTNVQNMHSFSLQIAGFDYSYEQRLGGDFSMVFRAGLLPEEISVYSNTWGTQSVSLASSLGIAIEPRYYTNFDRRYRMGKTTYKNSADFVALKIAGTYGGSAPRFGITPMYGIRRVWGKHWFGEFTTGLNVNYYGGLSAGLHLQYRLGFVF